MSQYPTHNVPPCGRPPQHPVKFGELNYTAEQINQLLSLIPLKMNRDEIKALVGFNTDNYIGHVASKEYLKPQDSFAWALVGDLNAATPFFYYTSEFVPEGYKEGWNDMYMVFGSYNLVPDKSDSQLTSEELFKVPFRLPDLIADCALKDENGNRIVDTYVTRMAVANYIRSIFNQLFIENPPLITDGYITPQMLSEAVMDILKANGTEINNVPDGEDLTAIHGVLKLSNKQYNTGAYSGLGRQYLRKNIVAGVNVLTQSMMQWSNTIYIIQYDYDLRGETITVPEGCVLDFQGGSLSNGTIIGNYCKLNCHEESFVDINIDGTFANTYASLNWFKISNNDYSLLLKKLIYIFSNIEIPYTYDIVTQINIDNVSNKKILGNGCLKTKGHRGISFENCSGITIENISLDGQSISDLGMYFVNCDDIVINGIKVDNYGNITTNNNAYGVAFSNTSNVKLYNSKVTNIVGAEVATGISLNEGCENFNIYNNTIENILPNDDADGVKVLAGSIVLNNSNINVYNNCFVDCAKRAIKFQARGCKSYNNYITIKKIKSMLNAIDFQRGYGESINDTIDIPLVEGYAGDTYQLYNVVSISTGFCSVKNLTYNNPNFVLTDDQSYVNTIVSFEDLEKIKEIKNVQIENINGNYNARCVFRVSSDLENGYNVSIKGVNTNIANGNIFRSSGTIFHNSVINLRLNPNIPSFSGSKYIGMNFTNSDIKIDFYGSVNATLVHSKMSDRSNAIEINVYDRTSTQENYIMNTKVIGGRAFYFDAWRNPGSNTGSAHIAYKYAKVGDVAFNKMTANNSILYWVCIEEPSESHITGVWSPIYRTMTTDVQNNEKIIGMEVFNTNINKPSWWDGEKMIEYDSNPSGIRRSGAYHLKPVSPAIGTTYLSIAHNNFERKTETLLVYVGKNEETGEDVWVDSMGRSLDNKDAVSLAWKLRSGKSVERPGDLTNANRGFQYYDTSIDKPIWWDGEKWIDATGAEV